MTYDHKSATESKRKSIRIRRKRVNPCNRTINKGELMCRKVFMSLIGILTMSVLAQSQAPQSESPSTATKCTLTVAEAPALRGIKLGMTAEQLFSLFPGSASKDFNQISLAAAKYPPFIGSVSFGVSEYNSPHNERLKDIDGISISLFDARIVDFTVQYKRGPNWFFNRDELVAKFSDALHLPPPSDWTGSHGASKVLRCNGFEIEVGIVNGSGAGRVSIRDPCWEIKAKQRREAEEERLRRDFKP